MKKKLYILTTLLLSAAVLSLSSCLKDKRNVDFSKATPVVYFNYGGLTNFGRDAITESTDTVVRQVAVSVSTAEIPKTATTITLAVDNSIITSYAAANPAVAYLPFPTGTFVAPTSVTIPAGQRSAVITVTLYKGLLDPSKSYMLPLKITSTTGGYTISGNMAVHYFHVIGNDFAGTYREKYQRYNAADSVSVPLNGASFNFSAGNTAIFTPVSPTEFTVYSGYVSGQEIRYDVTFTKNADGTYSNFHVSFVPDDVTSIGNSGITVATQPVWVLPGSTTGTLGTADLAGPFTFAEAQKIFHFQWGPMTSARRYIIDTYLK